MKMSRGEMEVITTNLLTKISAFVRISDTSEMFFMLESRSSFFGSFEMKLSFYSLFLTHFNLSCGFCLM